MRIATIVKCELLERKHQLFTSLLTIVIGIAAIVSINSITHFSEEAISQELSRLGSNVLILPKEATVGDYYAADMSGGFLPQEYVEKLSVSGIHGMDNLSPKLSEPVLLGGKEYVLTGILPKNEIRSKAVWQGGLGVQFGQAADCAPIELSGAPQEAQYSQRRIIDDLDAGELLVGYEAARGLSVGAGDGLEIQGRSFTVAAVLPQAGSIDDSRLFAHLNTVQEMTGRQDLIGVIEVVGCCKEIFNGLVEKINRLLPNAKVVTIGQVVATQQKTNEMMGKLSWAFLILIVLVGGASIANYMYGNVHERQQEIGALMALGAEAGFVSRLFLFKAAILGFFGGLFGYGAGTLLAMGLGPEIAGIPVKPLWILIPVSVGVSLGVAILATWLPARKAVRIDPCIAFRDI